MGHGGATRRLLHALERLDTTAVDNIARAREMRKQIDRLRAGVRAGHPLRELVEREERPLITELVTTNLEALQERGVELRRSQAEALREEGMTMQEIADLFGVSRQRVSSLLAGRSG